jgi:quercetin dioxygenase-like cupin family protein
MEQQQLKITPHESLTVRHSGANRLEVEATYAPHGKKPPAHYHPAQDEHFEVLEGRLHARVNGDERILQAGDTLDVERGVVHQMWNAGDAPARVRWTTTPAGRTLDWFTAIDALHRENKDSTPGPLAFGVLLTEYRDVFRLAARPEPVVRGAMAALGAVGRRRGYSAQA